MKNIITLLLFTPFICMGQQSKRVGINTPNPLQTLDISKNEKEIQKIQNGNDIPNKFLGTLGISETSVPSVPSDASDPNSPEVPAPTTPLGWIPVGNGTDANNGLIVKYDGTAPETLPPGLNTLNLTTLPGYKVNNFQPTHYRFESGNSPVASTNFNRYVKNGHFVASNGFLLGGITRVYNMALAVPDQTGIGTAAHPVLLKGGGNMEYILRLNKKANGDWDYGRRQEKDISKGINGRLGFSYPLCISYKHNGQWNLYADTPYTLPLAHRYENPDTGALTDRSLGADETTQAVDYNVDFVWSFTGIFLRENHFGSNGKDGYKEIDIDLSNANYYNLINGDFKQ